MNNARIQPPASPAAQRPWGARLARLWTYFSEYRLGWALAIAGTLISALTEASVPALLKPLLDEGFTQGSLPIWTVPLAIVGLFALRGVAHFASQYALARIANEGMVKLRRQLFDRHVGGLGQSGTDDTDSTARSCGDERSDCRDDEVVDA